MKIIIKDKLVNLNLHLVYNKEDFVFAYKSRYPQSNPDRAIYPKKYLCLTELIEYEGGLMGSSVLFINTIIPKECDKDDFILGYIAGRKVQDE